METQILKLRERGERTKIERGPRADLQYFQIHLTFYRGQIRKLRIRNRNLLHGLHIFRADQSPYKTDIRCLRIDKPT